MFAGSLVVVPRFAAMFAEMGITLPVPSLIAVSPMGRYIIGIANVVMFVIAVSVRDNDLRRQMNMVAFAGLVLSIAFFVGSLYMPLLKLQQALTSG
jgi:hypothetical protein